MQIRDIHLGDEVLLQPRYEGTDKQPCAGRVVELLDSGMRLQYTRPEAYLQGSDYFRFFSLIAWEVAAITFVNSTQVA